MAHKYKTGTKWGSRTIIRRVDRDYVETICDCGNTQIVDASSLRLEQNCHLCMKRGGRSTRAKENWIQKILAAEHEHIELDF